MDAETLDLIVRSRPTILEILENRGYDVDSHKGISPEEIFHLAVATQNLLRINAVAKPSSAAPLARAVVMYWVEGAYRQKLEGEMGKIWKFSPSAGPDALDPEKDELVVILSEPYHENFHGSAVSLWNKYKVRVTFFPLKNVITNPSKHTFVPPHRKLDAEERDAVIKALHLKSRYELPHIKFHFDMQARVLGLVPGDIVEIMRPSETCGEYTFYRVCSM